MRLLDLFCGAGGAAMGYHQAGFDEIVGVDIHPQPNYPFEFIQIDSLEAEIHGFDLIHASPPCQHFTAYRRNVKDITDRYEDLISPTQALLQGTTYVIENVPKAPIRPDLVLCGSMFDLDIRRHRWFEVSFPVNSPSCDHSVWKERKYKPSSNRKNKRFTIEVGSWDEPLNLQKQCMEVDWEITVRELSEAVPPAYTKYIGEQFLEQTTP